jgi:membrane protease subunit HflC
MQAERQREVDKLIADGNAEASRIRSDADTAKNKILAAADGQATRIRGEADAAASASLEVFNKAPELALFLLKLNALVESLKDRATLILDDRTPPFDLLTRPNLGPPQNNLNPRAR